MMCLKTNFECRQEKNKKARKKQDKKSLKDLKYKGLQAFKLCNTIMIECRDSPNVWQPEFFGRK